MVNPDADATGSHATGGYPVEGGIPPQRTGDHDRDAIDAPETETTGTEAEQTPAKDGADQSRGREDDGPVSAFR